MKSVLFGANRTCRLDGQCFRTGCWYSTGWSLKLQPKTEFKGICWKHSKTQTSQMGLQSVGKHWNGFINQCRWSLSQLNMDCGLDCVVRWSEATDDAWSSSSTSFATTSSTSTHDAPSFPAGPNASGTISAHPAHGCSTSGSQTRVCVQTASCLTEIM